MTLVWPGSRLKVVAGLPSPQSIETLYDSAAAGPLKLTCNSSGARLPPSSVSAPLYSALSTVTVTPLGAEPAAVELTVTVVVPSKKPAELCPKAVIVYVPGARRRASWCSRAHRHPS